MIVVDQILCLGNGADHHQANDGYLAPSHKKAVRLSDEAHSSVKYSTYAQIHYGV